MKALPAILSGILAACAGVFGKYGFQDSDDLLYYKVLSILIMLILNSTMIKYMVESFKEIGASKTTVINLTFNYVFSAVLGYAIYSEEVSYNWILGAGLMFIGVWIITNDR
ncbi:hypothetical protein SteCoe_31197 [Stentor coeruleus]|uniref:EamA domain-containing protein n=1 Tax=Stentor coeruleus TaxID=5963 RepID=A0A1R2B1U4_9CILI|nr:hypothetical protein SteCoe_31197 [Stentor coeruleus]